MNTRTRGQNRPFKPVLCAALLAFSESSHSAEAPALPPVVVTGSQLPQSEATVSQSAIIFSEPEIRNRAPASLPELLRAAPGLYVDQPGAAGGFASLYLRGADPSHTTVMIDGVKVSDPTNTRGGGIDLSLIDPQTIARVEVLPGASSAIYGPDAMAGVLNIITRQPQQTGFRGAHGVGGGGYRSGFAHGSLSSGALGLRAAAAATNDGRDTGFTRSRTGSLRMNAGNIADRHVSGWVRVQHQESGAFPDDSGGPVFAVRPQIERRNTDGLVAALNGEARVPWGSLRVYSNIFDQSADVDSPGVAPGVRDPAALPRSASASRYRRWALGATTVFGPSSDTSALLGLQYEKEQGEVSSVLFFGPARVPANFALERHTRSIFMEGRLKLSERASAQAGLRADGTEAHGTHTTMQAGLRCRPFEAGPSVAINYGTGFRPPSFFALGHPLVGNPRLKSEESRTVELSVAPDASTSAARPVSYRVALFRSNYINLVDFDPGPPPRLVNRDELDIRGYEATAAVRVGDELKLRAAITGLQFELPSGASPLRNRPRFRATSAAAYNVTPQLTASLYGSWVGRVFDSSIPTGGRYLAPYLLLDATLAYVAGGIRLVMAIDNVLNREYQQFIGFPGRGRRARFEVNFEI